LKEHVSLVLFAVVVVGVLGDVFFLEPTSDLVILLLTSLWGLFIWWYKLEGRFSVGAGMVFLALCPFLLILEELAVAEKVAIWAFMFGSVSRLLRRGFRTS